MSAGQLIGIQTRLVWNQGDDELYTLSIKTLRRTTEKFGTLLKMSLSVNIKAQFVGEKKPAILANSDLLAAPPRKQIAQAVGGGNQCCTPGQLLIQLLFKYAGTASFAEIKPGSRKIQLIGIPSGSDNLSQSSEHDA